MTGRPNDLLTDLQADLSAPRPEPVAPGRASTPTSPATPAGRLPVPSTPLPSTTPLPPARTTPALTLTLTPLRWSLPGLRADGGLSVRVGPLQIGLTRR